MHGLKGGRLNWKNFRGQVIQKMKIIKMPFLYICASGDSNWT